MLSNIINIICHLQFRSVAPLMEAVRCLMFFPFEAYIITSWIDELNPPAHLLGFLNKSIDIIRLLHVASIVLWLFVWYRNVRRNPTAAKAEMFFASDNKSQLIKEDKYVSVFPSVNKINYINQRKPLHTAVYGVIIIVSITVLWIAFALRYEDCHRILKSSTNIEL